MTRSPMRVSSSEPSSVSRLPRRNTLQRQMPLQRTQHRVLGARQLGGDLVAQLDLRPHPPSAALTRPETRLPSARPSTAAITLFIAWPMSLGDCAPLSATARSTIA